MRENASAFVWTAKLKSPSRKRGPLESETWQRKSPAISSCRCLRASPIRRRRSARRLVSAASTSWNSARRSTPPRRNSKRALPIPTVITVYADRSFSFTTKTPPASFLLKKAAKLKSGSKEPGKVSAGTIRRSQLAEIAEAKMKDLNANDIEAATKIIEGSARAMGLQVVEG